MKLLSVLFLVMLSFGCGGYGSGNGMQPASTTKITGLMPGNATAGGADFVLTVNGTGFASNSVVFWNSASVSTTYVSPQEVNANIPAADIADPGSATVYVNNPGTGRYAMGVNSNLVSFTIN